MSDKSQNLPWKLWIPDDLAGQAAEPSAPETQESVPSPAPAQTLEEDLSKLREKAEKTAWDEGFSQGKQAGYEAGLQQGLEDGRKKGLEEALRQQEPIAAQLRQMVAEFQQTLDELDNVIPARLMQLALTAAKQVLGQPPVCDGTALLGQIQQLIQQEPMFSGKTQLRVHPVDMERVEQHLGATLSQHGWRLLADNQMHPGGCKVSTEEGDLDATLATRWLELCRLAAPGEM